MAVKDSLACRSGVWTASLEQGRVPLRRSYRRMSEAWVYLVRCSDGSLYTGWTVDLERRLARHRAGKASRYTASRLPVRLVYAMPMPDRTAARREEARIKRLSRHDKLALLVAAESPVTTRADSSAGAAQRQ